MQVTDNDRQMADPTKLHNDPRLPYLYTDGKQDAADYKAVEEPPLPPVPGADEDSEPKEELWGAEKVAAQAGNPAMSPEVQPQDHAWNLPLVNRERVKVPDGKAKYADHYKPENPPAAAPPTSP